MKDDCSAVFKLHPHLSLQSRLLEANRIVFMQGLAMSVIKNLIDLNKLPRGLGEIFKHYLRDCDV